MNRYVLAPTARDDLQSIWDYIGLAHDSPQAANALIGRLEERFSLLASQPLMGELRDDLRSGLRVLSAENYVILYYPMRDGVEIVGVIHGARDLKRLLKRGDW
jgi:toxin ParE1/3/4